MNAQEARLHQRIEKFEGDMVRKSREMGKIGELPEEMWHMSRQTGRNKRNMQDKTVWSSSDGQNKCRRGKWSVEGERGRSQSLDRHQEKVEMEYGGIKRWEGNSVVEAVQLRVRQLTTLRRRPAAASVRISRSWVQTPRRE